MAEDFTRFGVVEEGPPEAPNEDFTRFGTVETETPDLSQPQQSSGDFARFGVVEQGEENNLGRQLQRIPEGVTGAFAEQTPTVAGLMAGAAIGTAIAPGIGTGVGAAVGAGAGFLAGQEFRSALTDLGLTFEDLESLPDDERPFALFGDVLGGSLVFSGVPLKMAKEGFRLGETFAGKLFNQIIDFAAVNPGKFLAIEGSAAVSSGLFVGAAEAIFPGRKDIRFGAELVGGVANIPFAARMAFNSVQSRLGQWAARLTESGRKSNLGGALKQAIIDSEGDPDALIAILSKGEEFEGVRTTAAQKTGDIALAKEEAAQRARDPSFRAKSRQMAEDSLVALRTAIIALRGEGSPEALRLAADLEARRHQIYIQSELDTAMAQAVQAIQAFDRITPSNRSQISVQAREAFDEAFKSIRRVETGFWEDVPENIPAEWASTLKVLAKIRGERIKGEPLAPVIELTARNVREALETLAKATEGEAVSEKALAEARRVLSTGELLKARSRALTLARDLRDTEPDNARQYGEFAEAILDDLDTAFRGEIEIPPGAGTAGLKVRLTGQDREAFETARNFSFELNERITRTFAGEVRERGRRGRPRIPPELMLREALATGQELGALQFRQLEEATRFLPSVKDMFKLPANELMVASQATEVMLDAQQKFMLLLARSATTKKLTPGGIELERVDPKKMTALLEEHGELLERFDDVGNYMRRAIETEEGLKAIEEMAGLRPETPRLTAAKKLLDVENPVDALDAMLRGSTPIQDLTEVIGIAKASGRKSVLGLRKAIFDMVIEQSTDAEGNVSLGRLVNGLTKPVRQGRESLISVMRNNDILDADVAARLVSAIQRAQLIAEGTVAPLGEEGLDDVPGVLVDLLMRTAGSSAGAAVGGLTGRSDSLIAMSAGSSAVRRVLDRIPGVKLRNLLSDALAGAPLEPGGEEFSLLTDIMERGTPESLFRAARSMYAFALQANYSLLTDEEVMERNLNEMGRVPGPGEVFKDFINTFGLPEEAIGNIEESRFTEEQVENAFAFTPLLNLIGRAEARGSYNAMNQGTRKGKVVGSGSSQRVIGRKLTDMTIEEVMQAQARKEIFAAGKYQLIPNTLKELVEAGGLSPDELFSPEIQDQLGILAVTKKRPAVESYLRGDGTERGALKALAKEFAGLPDPDTGRSFYPLPNKATVSLRQVKQALNAVKRKMS